jgi:hypothetical protein
MKSFMSLKNCTKPFCYLTKPIKKHTHIINKHKALSQDIRGLEDQLAPMNKSHKEYKLCGALNHVFWSRTKHMPDEITSTPLVGLPSSPGAHFPMANVETIHSETCQALTPSLNTTLAIDVTMAPGDSHSFVDSGFGINPLQDTETTSQTMPIEVDEHKSVSTDDTYHVSLALNPELITTGTDTSAVASHQPFWTTM